MTTSVGRNGKVAAKLRDSWVWRWPGREMPAKVSVTSIRSMARLLRGTRQQSALNSCKRGSCPRGREAGPPSTFLPGGRGSSRAGAIAGRALPVGPGGCGAAPGRGHPRDGTGSCTARPTTATGRARGARAPRSPGVGKGAGEPRWPQQPVVTPGLAAPRRAPRRGSPRRAPCQGKGSPSSCPRGAGPATSAWPRAIPGSPTGASCHARHRGHHQPPRRNQPGRPHRGRWAAGPSGASVSPQTALLQDRGARGAWHRGGTISSPTPGPCRPGCCPPGPSVAGRARHRAAGCAGTRPLPSARRRVGGWLWGGRSPSQSRCWHASQKINFPAAAGRIWLRVPGLG